MITLIIWFIGRRGWTATAEWFDLLIAILLVILVILVIVECIMCLEWFVNGYYKDRVYRPGGWKRWNEKYLSPQYLMDNTNMNNVSCFIFGCIIFTILLDLYKVVTFTFDVYWYITHVGNGFYGRKI